MIPNQWPLQEVMTSLTGQPKSEAKCGEAYGFRVCQPETQKIYSTHFEMYGMTNVKDGRA